MFISVKECLEKARENGYAVGAFNASDLVTVQAIAEAAKTLNAPVIIQTSPKTLHYSGINSIFDIVLDEIADKKISAAIHLDHAKDFSIVKECIDIGYPSVMIDASELDFESNIDLTKKVVNFGHEYGVSVEGELGLISKGENKSEMTDPSKVIEFIEKTAVDSIAVSVGNCHGAPKNEKINLELLEKISGKVKIPLVMHGSSGLSEADVRKAIGSGVAKFNIDTKIKEAYLESLEDLVDDETDPRELMNEVKTAIKQVVMEYIKLFGSENKA